MNLKRTLTVIVLTVFVMAAAVTTASAAGVDVQDPGTFVNKLVDLVKTVGMPIGGAVLFLSVVVIAVRTMISQGRPEKMAETMQGLLWVGVAGVVLGASLFLAGVFLGIGERLGS
ncbi:MAG: hypothetical protein H0Z39_07135 [Peptococcaceae bacterium]|nr:hypothetical protein [Peptococcaceae bacterium]